MNKIYSDQIEKATLLIDGLKKNEEFLKSKGYDFSVVAQLEAQCHEMRVEGESMALEEERLSKHRATCHAVLDRLKETVLSGKAGIKSRFDPDKWSLYGVSDKR